LSHDPSKTTLKWWFEA